MYAASETDIFEDVTFGDHVTVSENRFACFIDVKPVFATGHLSAFTRLDFFTGFSGQLRN